MLQLNWKMAAFQKISRKGDIPMGVLYVIRYAHSASGSLCAQSFPSGRIIFLSILLTSQLVTSTCPFAWGGGGGGMAWWCGGVLRNSSIMPRSEHYWSVSRHRWWWPSDNCTGQRCIVWRISKPRNDHFSWWGLPRPTWTHSPSALVCTLSRQKVGKVSWSLSPKGQRSRLQGLAGSTFHLTWRCLSPLDIVGTPCRNGGHPWRWKVSRSRFAGSYMRSCVPQNILCMSMSDTSPRYLLAPPLVCIVGWSSRILGGIEAVLPKISTWAHGRTYLFDADSCAPGSI